MPAVAAGPRANGARSTVTDGDRAPKAGAVTGDGGYGRSQQWREIAEAGSAASALTTTESEITGGAGTGVRRRSVHLAAALSRSDRPAWEEAIAKGMAVAIANAMAKAMCHGHGPWAMAHRLCAIATGHGRSYGQGQSQGQGQG